MAEVIRIVKQTFDTLENDESRAISEECVGTFTGGNGWSAYGNAVRWLSSQPPCKLYLAWNGVVYPRLIAVAGRTADVPNDEMIGVKDE